MKVALCCGDGLNYRGDWVGFDIVRTRFPGQLVLQDVRDLDGRRFRNAELVALRKEAVEGSWRHRAERAEARYEKDHPS